MSGLDSPRRRGAGGTGRPPRAVSRLFLTVPLLLLCSQFYATVATADPAPRLRRLLKAARTAVAGSVTATTSYDDDRIAVVEFGATTLFKGRATPPPIRLSLIELHEGSNAAPLKTGQQGLAFLRSAPVTSYTKRILPPGTYDQLLPEYGAFIAAADAADAARQTSILQRVARAAGGASLPAGEQRQLIFDLLACDSPVLVEDGAASLADLGRGATLSEAEANTLRAALLRTNLPDQVRIALVNAVADRRLAAMVPALRQIDSPPPVMEVAWRALDSLGAGAAGDELKDRLASSDAAVRTAAAREMLRRSGADAVQDVSALAVKDADPEVRLAVVEAIGGLKDPGALPTLELAFVDPSIPERQAAARAIRAIGGQAAVDALGRLAVAGPVDAQRYAVVVMMTLDDPNAAPILQRLAESHPDAETRQIIQHGFPYHHH